MYRQRGDGPTMSFTTYIDGTNAFDWRAAKDAKALYKGLWYALGTPGNQKAVSMPTLEIISVEDVDAAGLRGVKVTCAMQENQDPSSPSSALERAPFTVAIS